MPRNMLIASGVAALVLAGCRSDPSAPVPASAVFDASQSVVSIVSAGGSTVIDPGAPITVTFDHAMAHADSMEIVLHKGNVKGPAVPAATSWSEDRTKLTLAPAAPLEAKTTYTVEFRCRGMAGESSHATHHGAGRSGMMGGGTHGAMHGGAGGVSGGMMGGSGMMGSGAHRGAHGMIFTFTTA